MTSAPGIPGITGSFLDAEESHTGDGLRTLIDRLLEEQGAVRSAERFSRWHDRQQHSSDASAYRDLIPLSAPGPGEQYAFEVDLDACSGCKACVAACHALNGLEDGESWRSVGVLLGWPEAVGSPAGEPASAGMRHVTTACHHCLDPGCLNGCPVLAYEKDDATGIVRHLDDQCIGCRYCVMMCPYEVPRFSARLGIVRKCDLCHSRLAANEAPACAQACPNGAIRVRTVSRTAAPRMLRPVPANGDRVNRWTDEPPPRSAADAEVRAPVHLPASPDPAITLPATVFLARRTPVGRARAADEAVLRPGEAHTPLAIMLVFTQLAAGGFVADAVMRTVGADPRPAWLPWVLFGLAGAGMGASVLHLGQPRKAWRSFLNWRRSWLSREVIGLNLFAAGGLAHALFAQSITGWLAAVGGLAGATASAMVYIATRRELWRASQTAPRFAGTVVLGGALAFWATGGPQALRIAGLALLFVLVIKVVVELWVVRHRDDLEWTPLKRSARLALGPLRCWVVMRVTVVLTLIGLCTVAAAGVSAAIVWPILAFMCVLAGELLERHLFFAACSSVRMPGMP